MGASPTAPTISQDTAIQKLPPGAITSCGIDARCPRIAGAAANTTRLAGRGDRRVERNSWRAGEAHRALRTTEFGGRGLEFGAPTAGNPGHRAGSGSAHSAAISRIRLTYAPYAREIVQRELITWLIARLRLSFVIAAIQQHGKPGAGAFLAASVGRSGTSPRAIRAGLANGGAQAGQGRPRRETRAGDCIRSRRGR
jgi:hypothetical protein